MAASNILPGEIKLRPLQLSSIFAALEHNTSIISISTGGGKTYIYKIVAEAFELKRLQLGKTRSVTFIFSPLVQLVRSARLLVRIFFSLLLEVERFLPA